VLFRSDTLAGIAARDAFELSRWTSPDELERRTATLAGQFLEADRPKERLGVFAECFPAAQDLGRRLLHAVIKAGDRHAAILVVQVGQNLAQDADRVCGSAAVIARMQVAIGSLDHHFLANEPAQ